MKLIDYVAFLKRRLPKTDAKPEYKEIMDIIEVIHNKDTLILMGSSFNPMTQKPDSMTFMLVGETNVDKELIELVYNRYNVDSHIDKIAKEIVVERLAEIIDVRVYTLREWEKE